MLVGNGKNFYCGASSNVNVLYSESIGMALLLSINSVTEADLNSVGLLSSYPILGGLAGTF